MLQFHVSQSPSSVSPPAPESEQAPADDTPEFAKKLVKENELLRKRLDQQARDSDSKITKLTESVAFLNDNLQAALRARAAPPVDSATSSAAPAESLDEWDKLWGSPSSPTEESPQPQVQTQQKETGTVTPEEFHRLADERDRRKANQIEELQREQARLVERFRSDEFKDLHAAAPQINKLWDRFAKLNPTAPMETLFNEVISAAREFGWDKATPAAPEPAAPPLLGGGQPGRAASQARSDMTIEQQAALAETGGLPAVSQESVEKAMEEYVRERNRTLMQKSGFLKANVK